MTNPDHVAFELNEAAEHLRGLAEKIRSGEIGVEDDVSVEVYLGHVLDHLCFAWNSRNLSHELHMSQTQEDFERMTTGIPNFQGSRRLFKTTEYEKGA